MSQILIDVPNGKEQIYKTFIYKIIKTYSLDDLEKSISLQEHSLGEISKENLFAYKKSLNYKKEDLINL